MSRFVGKGRSAPGNWPWNMPLGNLVSHSVAMATSPWATGGAASAVNNSAVAPDGTTTATAITITAGTPGAQVWTQNVTTVALTTYTFSVWLWVASGTFSLRLGRTNGASWATAAVSPTLVVTTTPTRYSLTYTALAAETASGLTIGSENKTPFSASTGTFYAWGAGLNLGSYAAPYRFVA
jgi:hypothetical protein